MTATRGPLDRYTCEQAFRHMEAYLDRELGPDETRLVAEHVEVCAGCAEMFRFESSFLEEIRAKVRRVRIPPTLLRGVLARLEKLG